MEHIFTEAQAMLETLEIEKDLKQYLKHVLGEISANEEMRLKAADLYKHLFEQKEPLDTREVVPEEAEDAGKGELYSAVIFARVCRHLSENSYNGMVDFLDPFIRFSNSNKKRYGSYALAGTCRYWGYKYAFPRCLTLGRLVFEMTTFSYPYEVCEVRGQHVPVPPESTVSYPRLLKRGDHVLAIHVPGNDKLTKEAVDASFALAERFFAQYFPEYQAKAYVCSSWLLNTGLSRFLREESNILKFQKRFTIVRGPVNDFSLYDNIFEVERGCPLEKLVPTNRFQAEVLEHVKGGGLLYSGKGYILTGKESV